MKHVIQNLIDLFFPTTIIGRIIWISIPGIGIPLLYLLMQPGPPTTVWDFCSNIFLLYLVYAFIGRALFAAMGGVEFKKKKKLAIPRPPSTPLGSLGKEFHFIQHHNYDEDIGIYTVANGKILEFDPIMGELGSKPFDGFGDYVRPFLSPWRKLFLGLVQSDGRLKIYFEGDLIDLDNFDYYAFSFFPIFGFKGSKSKYVMVWQPDAMRSWPYNDNILESIDLYATNPKAREDMLNTILNQKTTWHPDQFLSPPIPLEKYIPYIRAATITLIILAFVCWAYSLFANRI